MPGISSIGMGSGIDLSAILDKIMQAETAPLARLDQKEKVDTNKITELSKLKNMLADLAESAAHLGDPEQFDLSTVNNSDPDILSIKTNSDATDDNFDITVQQLARSTRLRSAGFAQNDSIVGEGTLSISLGQYDADKKTFVSNPEEAPTLINIGHNQSSLSGIRDAINQAHAHVHASIVHDGSEQGAHLVITADETGEKHNIKITVTPPTGQAETGLNAIAYDPAATTTEHMIAAQTPQDALITLDGLAIRSDSNTLDKQIPGITLTLKKITEDKKSVHVEISTDNTKARHLLDDMLSAYNKLMKGLDAAKQKDSILSSDMSITNLSRSLGDILNTFIETGQDNIHYLSSIGAHADEDGLLSIHDDEFKTAMETKNFSIKDFFLGRTQSSSEHVTIEKINKKDDIIKKDDDTTTLDVQNLHLDILRPARDARVHGEQATGDITINDQNDTLIINNDKNITQIKIPAGQYNPQQLIAAINGQLKSRSTTVHMSIKIETEASGQSHYVIQNGHYGTDSHLTVSGNAAAAILGHMTEEAGEDVQVNINGTVKTGQGQHLRYGKIGLHITAETPETNILITQTPGLSDIADRLLRRENSKDGAISGSINSLNEGVKDLENQKIRLTDQLNNLKERYEKQFRDLDSYISKLNQTSSFLKSALR